MEEAHDEILDAETTKEKKLLHQLEAWQLEAAGVDRSVRILPGVKRVMNSIPKGKYAVATSGAKTYGLCLPILVGVSLVLMLPSILQHTVA